MDKLILIKEKPCRLTSWTTFSARSPSAAPSTCLLTSRGSSRQCFPRVLGDVDDGVFGDGVFDDGGDRPVSQLLVAQAGLRHGRHGPALLHQCQRLSSQLNGGWIFF